MKALDYLLLGCFSIMIGILLFFTANILYESMWIIRSYYQTGPPVSAFSNPVVLLCIVILLFTVVIGSGIVIGKKVAKLRKDGFSKVPYLAIPFSMLSVCCVLYAINLVCVKEYQSYISYKVVGVSSAYVEQIVWARELIIDLASRDCITGTILFLMGAFAWWMAMKIFEGDANTIAPI